MTIKWSARPGGGHTGELNGNIITLTSFSVNYCGYFAVLFNGELIGRVHDDSCVEGETEFKEDALYIIKEYLETKSALVDQALSDVRWVIENE